VLTTVANQALEKSCNSSVCHGWKINHMLNVGLLANKESSEVTWRSQGHGLSKFLVQV